MLISLFPGYYAVRAEVSLATISHSAVMDLGMVNLSYGTQPIDNILRMMKLPALLGLLQKIIGPRDYSELFRSFGDTLCKLHSLHLTPVYYELQRHRHNH
jgi:hypothetical protein